jgi:hypothetical protein
MKIPNMFLNFKLDKNEGISLDFSYLFKHFDWSVQDKLSVRKKSMWKISTFYFIQKKKSFKIFKKTELWSSVKDPTVIFDYPLLYHKGYPKM